MKQSIPYITAVIVTYGIGFFSNLESRGNTLSGASVGSGGQVLHKARRTGDSPSQTSRKNKIREATTNEASSRDSHIERMTAAEASAEGFRVVMTARKKTADETYVASLAKQLGLDSGQSSTLLSYCAEQGEKIDGLCKDQGDCGPDIGGIADVMNRRIPDSVVKGILNPEQMAKYADIRRVERERDVNVQALKEFANFSATVGLSGSPDSHSGIYQHFLEQASRMPDLFEEGGKWRSVESSLSGPGGKIITTYELEHLDSLSGISENSDHLESDIKQRRKEMMDQEVAALTPYLSEGQIQSLRYYLNDGRAGCQRVLISP